MFKRLFPPSSPKSVKPHSFTDEQICVKAYELWQQRGLDSTPEENWHDAIYVLQWEARRRWVTRPIHRWWWKTGLRTPIQSVWKWTGIPEKKGWDFVQLLAVPVVLSLLGWGLNEYTKSRDYHLADDKAKQDTLVKYLDQMADSLNTGLRKAKLGDDKFIVAQSRTVLALQSLNGNRQHLVIQFLKASGLSDAPAPLWKPTSDDQGNIKNFPAQSRVLLYKAQMQNANLVNSDFSGAVLIGSNLSGANFSCDLPSRDNNKCSNLEEADLRLADLSKANLSGAILSGANFKYADFASANLSGANFFFANLGNTYLAQANFSGANLNAANLDNAQIELTNFSNANLNIARLYHVFLLNANFGGANLNGANLNDALIEETNFSNADLSSADFTGAILLASNLSTSKGVNQIQLTDPKRSPLLCQTRLPDDLRHLSNRDCDQLPQVLLQRYPYLFHTLEEAKQHVKKKFRGDNGIER